MRYCSHCGKQIADEAVICVHCGCSVENGANPAFNKVSYKVNKPTVIHSTEPFEKNKILVFVNLSLIILSMILLFTHTFSAGYEDTGISLLHPSELVNFLYVRLSGLVAKLIIGIVIASYIVSAVMVLVPIISKKTLRPIHLLAAKIAMVSQLVIFIGFTVAGYIMDANYIGDFNDFSINILWVLFVIITAGAVVTSFLLSSRLNNAQNK